MDNSISGWVEREVDKNIVRELVTKLDCSEPLARALVGREIVSESEARSFLKPLLAHLPSCYQLENIEAAAEKIISAGTITLLIGIACFENIAAGLFLEKVLKHLNKKVNIETDLSSGLDANRSGLVLLIAADSRQDISPASHKKIVIIDFKSDRPAGQELAVYRESSPDCNRSVLAYYLSELLLRKYYHCEAPDFVSFDLETTGKNPRGSEIIEIGAVKFRKGQPVAEFETFVSSVAKIPATITDITGIENEDIVDAPAPKDALEKFKKFIGDDLLVAHNAGFDISFMRHHEKKYLGRRPQYKYEDTLRLAQSSLPGLPGFSLDRVADWLNIEMESHHRALSDAQACGLIYAHIKDKNRNNIEKNLTALLPLIALALSISENEYDSEKRVFYRQGLLQFRRSELPAFRVLRLSRQQEDSKRFGREVINKLRSAQNTSAMQQLLLFFKSEQQNEAAGYYEQLPDSKEQKLPDIDLLEQSGNSILCDGLLSKRQLNRSVFKELQLTAPWGRGNFAPCFYLTGCRVVNIRNDNENFVFTLSRNNKWFRALSGGQLHLENIKPGDKINALIVPVIENCYGREVTEFLLMMTEKNQKEVVGSG